MWEARHDGRTSTHATPPASSVHAFLSFPAHAHDAASKAGSDQFVRTAANAPDPYGITINAVQPGMVVVERYPDVIENYDRERWGPTIPLRRVGLPGDVAGPLLFLASDDAASVTGTVVRVDGGIMTRGPPLSPEPDDDLPESESPGA